MSAVVSFISWSLTGSNVNGGCLDYNDQDGHVAFSLNILL
jgi:hypothetical protein